MRRPLDPDQYEIDPDDGLIRAVVGPWAREKHDRLAKYVDISKSVRNKFLVGPAKEATFIDLFSGPGRARIRDTDEIIDGGCVAAWKTSLKGGKAFTRVIVSDVDEEISSAAQKRLQVLNAPVESFSGAAESIVGEVRKSLNPYGLHVAFLDPFNLDALPFSLLREFALCKRIDLLIHISVGDLQRNLTKYLKQESGPLDRFAPGWRIKTKDMGDQAAMRARTFEHWKELLRSLKLQVAEAVELVRGSDNQRLYWLALVAHDAKALEFWDKIRHVGPRQLGMFD